MQKDIKSRIRFYFDDLETPIGKIVDIAILFFIFIACVTYVFGTYEHSEDINSLLESTDLIVGIVFTIEYILRIWVAEKRIRHIFKIYSIIDLIAILPMLLTLSNLQFLRIFRLFRIFRILRFLEHRYFFFGAITENMLIISRILFTIITIIFICSGLILMAEKESNPNIASFHDAVYFSIVTLTTVGYGDIVPKTILGRFFTILIIASGLIFIPLQLTHLIKRLLISQDKKNILCEQCGLKYHDPDAIHCKHCGKIIYQENIGM